MSWEGTIPLNKGNHVIFAGFVDLGAPVLLANARISIWKPSEIPAGPPTVNNQAMSELGSGIYYYTANMWDEIGEYPITCWIAASNLYAYATLMVQGYVWDDLMAGFTIAGSFGEAIAAILDHVSDIKDGGLGGWNPTDDNLHEIKEEIKQILGYHTQPW